MPQLQIGDFAPQLIWLAITFSILYIALSRYALPRVEQVLTERRSRLTGDLEQARAAQDLSQQAAAAYDAALADARAKAVAAIKAARERLDRELDAERARKEGQMSDRMASAERDIEQARERALVNVSAIAAETAGDIVRRVAGLDVSPDEVAEMLRSGGRKTVEPVS
jgi:F-type H+-transporting ATPase subunit b